MEESLEALRARLERESDAELRSMCRPLVADRFEPEAIAVAREILTARGVDLPAATRCPRCESEELEPGDVRVHGTLLGFLAVGLSHQHLWFRSDETGQEQVAVGRHERLSALRCRACGTMILER